ncbi:MAG: hypothetical protein K6T68_06125 [Alicyclobacillus shizuokensis]|nr:hypothetical protein [Alicyclobacillus shizuokensis]
MDVAHDGSAQHEILGGGPYSTRTRVIKPPEAGGPNCYPPESQRSSRRAITAAVDPAVATGRQPPGPLTCPNAWLTANVPPARLARGVLLVGDRHDKRTGGRAVVDSEQHLCRLPVAGGHADDRAAAAAAAGNRHRRRHGRPGVAGVGAEPQVPEPTRLDHGEQQAARRGAERVDGLDMLVRQGVEALEFWLGVSAPVEVMRQAARASLGL